MTTTPVSTDAMRADAEFLVEKASPDTETEAVGDMLYEIYDRIKAAAKELDTHRANMKVDDPANWAYWCVSAREEIKALREDLKKERSWVSAQVRELQSHYDKFGDPHPGDINENLRFNFDLQKENEALREDNDTLRKIANDEAAHTNPCVMCAGTGHDPDRPTETCKVCKGSGHVHAQPAIAFRWEEDMGDLVLFTRSLCVGSIYITSDAAGNSLYRASFIPDNAGDCTIVGTFPTEAEARAALIAHVTKLMGGKE